MDWGKSVLGDFLNDIELYFSLDSPANDRKYFLIFSFFSECGILYPVSWFFYAEKFNSLIN